MSSAADSTHCQLLPEHSLLPTAHMPAVNDQDFLAYTSVHVVSGKLQVTCDGVDVVLVAAGQCNANTNAIVFISSWKWLRWPPHLYCGCCRGGGGGGSAMHADNGGPFPVCKVALSVENHTPRCGNYL